MRRFGDPPKPDTTYVRRPGVYAILPYKGGILATFQGGVHNEFQLPGGGIDPGENPTFALHREVLEETGWAIKPPRFFLRFKRYVEMPEYGIYAEKICSIYIAHPLFRRGVALEPDHDPKILSITQACQVLANPGDRFATSLFFGSPRKVNIKPLISSSKSSCP